MSVDRKGFIEGLKSLVEYLEKKGGEHLTFADVMDFAGQTHCGQVEEDMDGQLVIYTGWKEGTDVIETFEAEEPEDEE